MATLTMKAKELQTNFEKIIYQFQTVAADSVEATENLSPKELNALVFVGKKDGCIMREISAFLRVADSTVTMLVDKLVQKKFVKRELSDEDRRIIKVLLTDSGKEIYQEHLKGYQKFCRGMLMTLEDGEQELYIALMKKIAVGAKEQFEKI